MTATMPVPTVAPVRRPAAVALLEYPCSDGLPMADSDAQANAMREATAALRLHFRDRRDRVYVTSDTFVYYREDDAQARVAPDVFVVLGVPAGDRDSYFVWLEGRVPQWVLEVASRSTVGADLKRKRDLYERLGVREYWQFDPTGETLGRLAGQRLQGHVLEAGGYAPLRLRRDGSARSRVLGLELEVQGRLLRFRDPETGLLIPILEESEPARQEESRKRQEESRMRRVAEQERDTESRKRQEESRRRRAAEQERDTESRRRRAAEQERDTEARKRRELEARLAALRAKPAQSAREPPPASPPPHD